MPGYEKKQENRRLQQKLRAPRTCENRKRSRTGKRRGEKNAIKESLEKLW